jgi:hypothetical protein
MKKRDIKIIKGKTSPNNNNYTFIDDINIVKPIDESSTTMKEKTNGEQSINITGDSKKDEKYKKKKVVSKHESNKKFKALKFSNPSQRNHSSIYE